MNQGVKYFFEHLEHPCHLFPRNPLRKLFVVFYTCLHVLGHRHILLTQIINWFDSHMIQFLCFFVSNTPYFLKLQAGLILPVLSDTLALSQPSSSQYLTSFFHHGRSQPFNFLEIVFEFNLFIMNLQCCYCVLIYVLFGIVLPPVVFLYLLQFLTNKNVFLEGIGC